MRARKECIKIKLGKKMRACKTRKKMKERKARKKNEEKKLLLNLF